MVIRGSYWEVRWSSLQIMELRRSWDVAMKSRSIKWRLLAPGDFRHNIHPKAGDYMHYFHLNCHWQTVELGRQVSPVVERPSLRCWSPASCGWFQRERQTSVWTWTKLQRQVNLESQTSPQVWKIYRYTTVALWSCLLLFNFNFILLWGFERR